MQLGLYLHLLHSGAWHIVSEDSDTYLLSVFPADYLHPTHCYYLCEVSSVGYSDVPAFSQVSLRQRFHLRACFKSTFQASRPSISLIIEM
jgi:hypothetical protein